MPPPPESVLNTSLSDETPVSTVRLHEEYSSVTQQTAVHSPEVRISLLYISVLPTVPKCFLKKRREKGRGGKKPNRKGLKI